MVHKSDSDELAALRKTSLEAYGIEWRRKPQSPVQCVSVLSTDEKLRYFVGCFVGVVMYGAFDGKVKLAENKSTRLPTDLFTQGIFVFHNVAY